MPVCKRTILPIACCPGVGAGLHRSPIVSGGQKRRVHTVENALVVGRCSVWVRPRERVGLCDPINYLAGGKSTTFERLGWYLDFRPSASPVTEIGENAQSCPASTESLQQRRHGFSGSVGGVGAHCVAAVDQQVNNQHRTCRCVR